MPTPRTYAICEKFGMHARFLSSVGHYNTHYRFEGLVLPLRPEGGRQELNTILRRDAKDLVVVIDGTYHGITRCSGGRKRKALALAALARSS